MIIDKQKLVNELFTIGDWIRYSFSAMNQAELFYGHGTDNSWDESISLVYQALHLPWDALPELWHCNVTAQEKAILADWLEQRVEQKKPLPYIAGKAMFAGYEFIVSEDTLIPRSPIFQLIENDFEPWAAVPEQGRMLDLCTGSGCLAILMAEQFPEAEVVGSDISEAALTIAEQNKVKLGVDNVSFVESRLFDSIDGTFDVIVTNPPYVGQAEMQSLPDEYRHEPEMALEAEDNGLLLVKEILRESAQYLNDNGVLILEVGNSDEYLMQSFPECPFMWVEFEQGGHGVCVLQKAELERYFID